MRRPFRRTKVLFKAILEFVESLKRFHNSVLTYNILFSINIREFAIVTCLPVLSHQSLWNLDCLILVHPTLNKAGVELRLPSSGFTLFSLLSSKFKFRLPNFLSFAFVPHVTIFSHLFLSHHSILNK